MPVTVRTAAAGNVQLMSDAGPTEQVPAGSIALVEEDGVPVLRLRGDIDTLTVSAYDRAVAPGSRQAPAVIDASAVTFLDGRGLRFLVRQASAARVGGGRPVLRRPPRVVRRVIDVVGAADLFVVVR